MTDKTIEQRARELLATEYERQGLHLCAEWVRNGGVSDDISAPLRAIARALEQPVKPFPAPGAWFPTNVMGGPMREFAPGRWESATWPSEQPEGREAVAVDAMHAVAVEAWNSHQAACRVTSVSGSLRKVCEAIAATTPPTKVPDGARVMPGQRAALGDMGEGTRLSICRQEDGDLIVSVIEPGMRFNPVSVEFCTPGGGGGKNSALYWALSAAHSAMPAFDIAAAQQPKEGA